MFASQLILLTVISVIVHCTGAAKTTTKSQLWTLVVALILLAMSAHCVQCLLGA